MNGNFSRLSMNGGGLKAEGWLAWAAGERSATLSITVTQGTTSATKTIQVWSDKSAWDTTIENVVFQEDVVASGQAGGTVTYTDDSTAAVTPWTSAPLRVE
jgi:hypothetical protein